VSQRNGSSAVDDRPGVSREFLSDLMQNDVDDHRMFREVGDLLGQDYPLANLTSGDREYFRLLAENVALYIKEQHPHRESWAQGGLGAALYDDEEFGEEHLDPSEVVQIETALMDHFARSSRGVNGWQQDKLTESIQTNRVEDNRENGAGDDSSGGLFGWF
jgi:hypothetical protein